MKNGWLFLVLLSSCYGLSATINEDLIAAARAGDAVAVQASLDAGADVHASDGFGSGAPLREAARNGHVAVVQLLLDADADVHARDPLGPDAPLRWAAENGHVAVAQLLLGAGADVHARDGYGPEAALRRAAKNGHVAVAQLLLDADADVHARDLWGPDAPLQWTALYGHVAVAQLLLGAGADVHASNVSGSDAPLKLAARKGHVAVVSILRLCSLPGFEEFRRSPQEFIVWPMANRNALLLWSVVLNRPELVASILKRYPSAANSTYETAEAGKMTALMFAAMFGFEDIVGMLLRYGAAVQAMNREGKDAMTLAADHGQFRVAAQLTLLLMGHRNIF